jgi:hypothetical protein
MRKLGKIISFKTNIKRGNLLSTPIGIREIYSIKTLYNKEKIVYFTTGNFLPYNYIIKEFGKTINFVN